MKDDSPAKTLAWMATGAAVLAAGALLGAVAARPKEQAPAAPGPEPTEGGPAEGELEDLDDRPVAQAALAETVAAARRVEILAGLLEKLESRVQSLERASSTERVEAVWQRVVQLEAEVEQIRAQRVELPPVENILAQAENRLSPRIRSLEARVEEHHAAIQQLQLHAAQAETNLQKMIVAVEKLAEQISRVMPGGRLEPRKEGSGPAAAERPAEGAAKPGGPFALRGR